MVTIRTARRGEGKDVERLESIAMGGRPDRTAPAAERLPGIVDAYGGEFTVKPMGKARTLVAVRQNDGSVCGLAQVFPPIRLMNQHADRGLPAQRTLAKVIGEIDLLAVDADARGQGTGGALLEEAEKWLADRGCLLVMAKIARGDYQVMRWYRRRGYLVAAQGEMFWVTFPQLDLKCDDGGDGYHLALKGLRGAVVSKARMGNGTYVTARFSGPDA
ncbi:GNAT family N-acetyltransferase [Streptomyces sp. NPDC046275]|uniref:GNAT family N-acetyltransferase n=1 Tax=Streptomyces sp. NPDC046275 TaxID=3157201 RepID=UPI0033F9F708